MAAAESMTPVLMEAGLLTNALQAGAWANGWYSPLILSETWIGNHRKSSTCSCSFRSLMLPRL